MTLALFQLAQQMGDEATAIIPWNGGETEGYVFKDAFVFMLGENPVALEKGSVRDLRVKIGMEYR